MFEENDPPKTYKKFRREVMRTIESTEVLEGDEEEYPSALFIVNRDNEGQILYLKDFVDEDDEDEVDLKFLIGVALPHIVKYENSKYYAFIFSGEKAFGEKKTSIVVMLSGSMYETDMVYSEYTFEGGEAVLEPWEKDNVLQYPDLVVPFRRAICPQG